MFDPAIVRAHQDASGGGCISSARSRSCSSWLCALASARWRSTHSPAVVEVPCSATGSTQRDGLCRPR